METIERNAYRLLLNNAKYGIDRDGREYFYVCPAPSRYPHQWFWDSCFHAIVMRHFDIELAKKEILSLVSVIQPDGFLPHTIFRENAFIANRINRLVFSTDRFSRIIQSPVLPITVEKIFEIDHDEKFLNFILPIVKKYYLWLQNKRDLDKDGLISSIHAFEVVDGEPSFDYVYGLKKPTKTNILFFQIKTLLDCKKFDFDARRIREKGQFIVKSRLVNCVYAQGLRSLSRLSKIAGKRKDVTYFKRLAEKVEQAIISKFYDKESKAFYNTYSKEDKQIPVLTVSSLMPVILDNIPKNILQPLIETHLLNPEEFWLPYPIPCVAKSEPQFNVEDTWPLWRGPTWINTNWFIVKGLQKHGYHEIADEITQKTKKMILTSGFWEFYNPFTGKGMRTENHGWSTLVVDMLKDDSSKSLI